MDDVLPGGVVCFCRNKLLPGALGEAVAAVSDETVQSVKASSQPGSWWESAPCRAAIHDPAAG
ncbi:MAG: hypothetical protein KC442_22320 [Thermomicrobiales bacterium]|nr:hypothetical protein [Thermomicrobiales bacterium]